MGVEIKTGDVVHVRLVVERYEGVGNVLCKDNSGHLTYFGPTEIACVEPDVEIDRLNGRVTELLERNNRFEEEARQARRERDALLRAFQAMALAFARIPYAGPKAIAVPEGAVFICCEHDEECERQGVPCDRHPFGQPSA